MVLNKFRTVRFPLAPVLMELAVQLRMRNLELRLDWLPRDLNQPADSLSNFEFEDFSPELQVKVELEEMHFEVLDEMLEEGATMYSQLAKLKAQKLVKQPWKGVAGTRSRLKDRQPW